MKHTVCCLLQNRLGALDRLLGALTYRGLLPEQLMCTQDNGTDCLQVVVSFECADEKAFEKLVKVLDKQVYVMEVKPVFASRHESDETLTLPTANITQLFDRTFIRRRPTHAVNR